MRRIVLVLVLLCSLLAVEVSAEIPPTVRNGETKYLSTCISVCDEKINEIDHIRELYGMCALKDPDGNVVWSEDSVPVSSSGGCIVGYSGLLEFSEGECFKTSSCSCPHTSYVCRFGSSASKAMPWTFDKEGIWKPALAIGYIDKKWNYETKEWVVDEGISVSKSYEIKVSEIPEPPETSQELLEKLFNLFLNSF